MKTALIDLDSMVYAVAYRQWTSGNRDRPKLVSDHIKRFIHTIEKSSKCTHTLKFYQDLGHDNYRKKLLPEYKGHRKSQEFVTHWKPTIVKTFQELDAIALLNIETDDAINIVGRDLGLANITIVTSDKDMRQVACDQYNPFKKGKANDPTRWFSVSKEEADRFFWEQAITGDSTDMPGELCGIEGVGPGTVAKEFKKSSDPYPVILQRMYTEKYGEEEGLVRAARTYKMTRLLTEEQKYLPIEAKTEVSLLLKIYKPLIKEIRTATQELFGDKDNLAEKLFKS